jgi:hypothetical protein
MLLHNYESLYQCITSDCDAVFLSIDTFFCCEEVYKAGVSGVLAFGERDYGLRF